MSDQRLKTGLALNRIVEHASKIESLCDGLDLSSFLASPAIPDAVGMNLIAIGQRMIDIREDDEDTFSSITGGNEVIGMRHILAHDYVRIDFSLVWRYVSGNLPVLIEETSRLRDRYVDEYKVQID